MTRTSAAARSTTRAGALKRKLALSSALGVTLAVAAPAWAQQQGSFGTVTGTDTSRVDVLGFPTPQPGPTFELNETTQAAGVAGRLDVDLNARNTVIEWSKLSVLDAKTLSFNHGLLADTSAKAVLNRVTSPTATATEISGNITTGTRGALGVTDYAPGTSNIQVWIVNGAGIMVGRGANINTGGLVLSALNIDTTNTTKFRDTAAGTAFAVKLASTGGAGITTVAGAAMPAQINTSNGVLALIAPTMDVAVNASSGTGPAAFALATDVDISTAVGSPLSLTLNAGTGLNGTVAGTIVGDRVYALLRPQDGVNALLSVTAGVSNATVDARGVVVLSGTGLSQTVAAAGAADTLSTGTVSAAEGTLGRAEVGTVSFATPRGTQTPTTGTVTIRSTSAGSLVSASAASDLEVTAGSGASVSGAVTVGGNYTVAGTSVTLGDAGGAGIVQAAGGAVTLTGGAGGTITGLAGLTLTANSDGTTGAGAEALSFDPGAGGAIAFAATTTINGGSARQSSVYVGGNDVTVMVGAVNARSLATSLSNPVINRDANFQAGPINVVNDLQIRANNIRTGQIDVSGLNQVARLETSGTPILVSGAINSGGSISLLANSGSIGVGALTAFTDVEVVSSTTANGVETAGAVTTGNILAGSTVTLRGDLVRTGAIGTDAMAVANVTIDGGEIDVNGADEPVGIASSATVSIGQSRAPASLIVRGALQAGGNLVASAAGPVTLGALSLAGDTNAITATGAVQTGAVTLTRLATDPATAKALTLIGTGVTVSDLGEANGAVGSVTVNAAGAGAGSASLQASDLSGALVVDAGTGGASFTTLAGAGSKSITSTGAISGTAITGAGAVTLTPGASSVLTLTGDVGTPTAPVASLTIGRGGAVQLGAVFATGVASLGQTNPLGSLTLSGALVAGSLVADTSGLTSLQAVTTNAGGIDVVAGGNATIAGAVSAAGNYELTGSTVTLGATGGTAVTQMATGAVAITATGGAGAAGGITGRSGLTLTSDSDASGGEALTLGGANTGTIGFAATTTINAGRDGGSALSIQGLSGADTLSLGAVNAATVTQTLGTPRGGAITLGALTLSGASNTIATTGTLTAGAVTLTGAGAGTLTLTGRAGVTTGAITEANGATGTVTVNADTGAAAATIARATLGGTLVVNAGTGGAVLGALSGAGAKTVRSAGSIGGAGVNGASFSTSGSGAVDLLAGAAGTITAGGISATGDKAASLTINGARQVTINGAVNVAAETRVGQDVDTPTGALTVTGALTSGELIAITTGDIRLASGTTTTSGAALSLTSGSRVEATSLGSAGTLALAGTADGGTVVTVGTIGSSGDTTLGSTGVRLASIGLTGPSTIGGGFTSFSTGATALGTLGVTGALNATTTTGGVTFAAVSGAGAKTVTAGGSITGGTFAGAGALDLEAGATGTIDIAGITDQIASLTVNGGALATVGGAVNVVGATGVGLAANGAIVGAVSFTGALTTGSLASRTTGAASFQSVTTAGSAGGTIRADSTGGGAISFAGVTDGGGTFVTDTTGTTRFGGAVGATTPFASLSTLGTGGVAIDGGSVRTVGAQRYGGAVTLSGAPASLVTLTATDTTTGDGTFTGGIVGAGRDLTLDFAGATTIAGSGVGMNAVAGVRNLIVGNGGTTALGGAVATSGTQSYGDATTLTADTVLTSTGEQAIGFSSTLSGGFALQVVSNGTFTLAGVVGGAPGGALASITTDGEGSTLLNGGAITTTGDQRFNGTTVLGANTTLNAGAGAIAFAGALTGGHTLALNSTGTTSLGSVGQGAAANRLVSLTTDAGGTTTLNGSVTTTGAQTYGDPVTLGASITLRGASGSFTTVNGAGYDLTLDFGSPLTIGGEFTGIDDLDVIGVTALGGTVSTTGRQRYRGAVTLAATTNVQSGSTGIDAVAFDSTVDGAQALTVATGGTTSFGGLVGNTTALASLDVSGTGPVVFNAGIPSGGSTVTTGGLQRYAGAVILGADARFATTAGGAVNFGGTVDGAHLLSIATTGTGAAGFAGRLGGTTALTGLAIDAQTVTVGATGNRVGTIAATVRGGGLTYDDAAALTVGAVGGLSGVSTTGTATLSAGGLLTLARNIGGAAALTGNGVTQNAGAAINAGAGTIAIDGNDGAVLMAGTLQTSNATASAVRIVDASGVTLGTVAAGAGTVTIGGAAGDAIGGAIGQSAGGTIAAGTLTGNAGGATSLTNTGNAVATLGAFAANGFALRVGTGLTVVGPVDAGNGDLAVTLGGGTLALAGPLTASAGTVTLANAGGPITQSTAAGGGIVAARLTGSSVGGTTLRSGGNAVGTLAGFTNTGAGGFDLVNAAPLAITATVDGGQTLAIAANGIGFAGQTLRATQAVTLDGRSAAVTGGSAIAGTDLTVTGSAVDIGTATAGNGAAGILQVTTTAGALRLGSAFAGQRATLRAAGDLTVTNSLTAGTAGNTASASAIDVIATGAASAALATSNNGGVSIVGNSAAIGRAVAANGALLIRATGGALTLGSGSASGDATLEATGAGGSVDLQGALGAGGAATATGTGLVRLDSVSAATTTAVRSTAGRVEFGALTGAATKSVTAATSIAGGSIVGTGAVTLAGGSATTASNTVVVAAIGAAAPVASLTVNGGSAVTLGSAGGTINVTGATRVGQAPGATTGALTVNGALVTGVLTTSTTGATGFGALTLNATGNAATAGGQLTTGAVTLAGGGARSLVLTGDGGVSTGALGNTGGAVGTVTVDADAGAGEARVASADLAGPLTIAGGTAGATFGSLAGVGNKSITSTGGIRGTGADGSGATIDGGTVTLVAGSSTAAGNTVRVDAIGTAAQVASLTINGGSTVTLGAAGATGASVSVAGATAIGVATNGPATGALAINGAVDSDGSFTASTTGAIRTGAVDSIGALALTAGTDIATAALSGAGNKTLTAGGAIAGTSIDGGEVRLRAGPSGTAANTIQLASVGSSATTALLAINGGSAVTITGPVTTSGAVTVGQGTAAADLTGALTIGGDVSAASFASTTTGATRLAGVTSNGLASVTTTAGDVTFATLAGNGEKRVVANGGIAGTAITGTGAVTLTPAAGGAVTITGGVGADAVRAASLTVTRGGAVQIGPVFVGGAASFGQTAPLGSLTLGAASVGSLVATSTGTTRLATVASPGLVQVTTTGASGDVLLTALTGAGDKRLRAGAAIAGTNADGTGGTINGGAVTLVAGTANAAGTVTLDAVGTGAALTSLAIDGGAGVTLGRAGNTGAAVVVTGATTIGQATPVGAVTVNGTTTAATLATTSTGATVLTGGVTANGGAIAINAGSLQAQTLVAIGAVAATTGGDAALVGGSSGGDFAVAAGGAARVSGALTAGGAYRVRGASVSLGTGTTAQGARGLVDIVTTGGTLTGSSGLTLTSNSDGAGAEYLAIDANGGIAFGGVALVGGTTANASDVSVVERAAGAAVTLGTVTGRQLGSFDTGRTAIGTLATSGAVTATGLVNVQRGLAIATTGGAIALDEVRVTDTGQGITLTTAAPAGSAITARALSANTSGTIAVDARGAAQLGTSSGGTTTLRGTAVQVGTATARGTLALTSTAGSVTLGTGDANGAITIAVTGGDAEVTARLTAGGATTIGASGAARLTQVAATAGDLAVTAGGGVSGVGTGRANLLASGSGANVRVQAGGAALLGTVQAAAATTVQAASIDATATVATAGALSLTATGGNVTLGSGTAGTSALLDATQTVATGAVSAGGSSAITLRALDAALTGSLRAGQVAFVNRTPAGNAFKLGNGTSTGGFQLSATEVNLVDAATLTVDGGAGNVEFGALAFGANAGRTNVDVLSTGRIDVLGAVSGSGSGRTFRLGGNATSTEAKAGVIELVATAAGGGRLLVDTANLDLRGGRIGAGQAAGFLDTLGFGAGQSPASVATVGELFVGNANSSLYNSTFGGALYNPTGVTFLSASTLTVRYTDYALFQNTGAPGINAGVVLGSQASPVSNALVLQGSGTNNPNSFALFGTINGITGTPAAVLGPTVISVNNVSLATTRLNGCIVGSGAGCLTSVVSQPVLNVFDASRLDVFRTADDLALPFDPVIGTNNEALFSGITLTDVPVTSNDCPDGADTPQCRQPQTQGEPK